MESKDEPTYDLQALEEDRRRNLEDRVRMLDAYAEWLKTRGVVEGAAKEQGSPMAGKRARRKRPRAGRR